MSTKLAFSAVASLALASLAFSVDGRGSSARKETPIPGAPPLPSPRAQAAAIATRKSLGVRDVRLNEREIYLIGTPRQLEMLVRQNSSKHLSIKALLRAAGIDKNSIQSYGQPTIWDELEDVISFFFQEYVGHFDSDKKYLNWSVKIIPLPGGPTEPSWSAEKRRMVPATVVEPFRFCKQPSVHLGSSRGPALLELSEKKIPPLFLSHGITLEGLDEVERCGGFLWPSLALTWRAPESYGDVIFLFDVSVVPNILKPTGRASRYPHLYLAGTDIWSPTARDLLNKEKNINLQLIGEQGHSSRGLQNRLLISEALNPRQDDLVSSMSYGWDNRSIEATDRIESRPVLIRTLRSILKEHTHGNSVYHYPDKRNRDLDSIYRYPYAEMKVSGVVHPSSAVACFYPSNHKNDFFKKLDIIGFSGFRVPFDWNETLRNSEKFKDPDSSFRWASSVTKAVLDWARYPCNPQWMGESVKGQQTVDPYTSTLRFPSRGFTPLSPRPPHGSCPSLR